MLLGGALLLEGCVRQLDLDPAPEGESISFRAGSTLLRDDATTKSLTESFTHDGEAFTVFGERVTASDVHSTVFNGVDVTHRYGGGDDYWYYTTARFWYWVSTSDRYDFVAISPSGHETVNEHAADNLSVSTHYDLTQDNYDILAATYRRRGTNWESRYNRVDLSFSHIGSAVAVTVVNNSSTTDITVTSIYYKNLVVDADAKVTFNNQGQAAFRWANFTPSRDPVRELTRNPATVIEPGHEYTGEYQIMIPHNLSLYGAQLYLTYKVGDNPETFTSEPIALADIKRSDGTAITSWEIGYKYNYNVSMRLDGGLLVTVNTTPWDVPVEAETPGILI